jgi:hypothetical protein
VPDGAIADPVLCSAATCAVTELALDHPVSRLVVAVDTSELENTFDFLYDIQLHVYAPDGTHAGGDDGSFESNVVVVDDPPVGTWRVVVMPSRSWVSSGTGATPQPSTSGPARTAPARSCATCSRTSSRCP